MLPNMAGLRGGRRASLSPSRSPLPSSSPLLFEETIPETAEFSTRRRARSPSLPPVDIKRASPERKDVIKMKPAQELVFRPNVVAIVLNKEGKVGLLQAHRLLTSLGPLW